MGDRWIATQDPRRSVNGATLFHLQCRTCGLLGQIWTLFDASDHYKHPGIFPICPRCTKESLHAQQVT